uniref:Uncharacterized protein n=1 Tax=Anopheles quadriannulatus TaxID=34691 RepID=A0A182XQR9_ANOQN
MCKNRSIGLPNTHSIIPCACFCITNNATSKAGLENGPWSTLLVDCQVGGAMDVSCTGIRMSNHAFRSSKANIFKPLTSGLIAGHTGACFSTVHTASWATLDDTVLSLACYERRTFRWMREANVISLPQAHTIDGCVFTSC